MIRRSSPPRRRSPLARGGPIKKKKRSAKEFARVYGGLTRLSFVKGLPCAACGRVGESANHHTKTGGTSRKADYTTIIALCPMCHFAWHQQGRTALEGRFQFDAFAAAVMTEAKWIAHSVKESVANDVSKR